MVILIRASLGFSQDAKPLETTDESISVKEINSPAETDVEVMDLNEIDLEEAEQAWDHIKKDKGTNITDSIKIQDILEPPSEYRYSSFGKKDPFRRPASVNSQSEGKSPDSLEIPMVSPLQAYPLEELMIKGVWVLSNGEARAIVMTPKKEGIVVKKGDPIAAGKIMKIDRDRITVRQYRMREDGVREFEDREIDTGLKNEQKRGVIQLSPGKDPVFINYDENKQIPTSPQGSATQIIPVEPRRRQVQQTAPVTTSIVPSTPNTADKVPNSKNETKQEDIPLPNPLSTDLIEYNQQQPSRPK